jgi:hypothetical protein
VVVLGALLAAPSATSRTTALPRATEDRPDDIQGPQVHVLYVVPRDGVDRGLDTNGVVDASVASWQRWLRGQTGGRGLRLDTFQGQLDVTFLRMARTDAQAESRLDLMKEELSAAGFRTPDRIYALYYDGGSAFTCGGGGGGVSPRLDGAVTAIFLRGTPPGAPPCASNALGLDPPGYFEFAMLHEIVHTMGFVPPCAPHITARSHVSDSRFDLMWTGDAPWGVNEPSSMRLDVGRDDYYEVRIPGCPDLAGSRFLEGGGARLTIGIRGSTSDASVGWQGAVTCETSCVQFFDAWPVQRLTLSASTSSERTRFVGWRGACTGTAPTCSLELDSDKSVEAMFGPATARLSVATSGRGTVRSSPQGIACPSRCAAAFVVGSRVALRATPARGSRFAGWRGACRGLRCTVVLSANRSVRAVFRRS